MWVVQNLQKLAVITFHLNFLTALVRRISRVINYP
jgi:hypothetical protein